MLSDDFIFYKNKEGDIMSGGYKVNSILKNPVMKSSSIKKKSHKQGDGESVSDLYNENLAVPSGLYVNKPLINFFNNYSGENEEEEEEEEDDNIENNIDKKETYEGGGGTNEIIPDNLFNTLIDLVKVNKNSKKTKKKRKNKLTKTKKVRNIKIKK